MRPVEQGGVRTAFGVRGLVVLFVLLGGFVAMHGIAATTETGTHHNPGVVLVAPQHDMPGAPDDDEHGGSHALMTGCLVALLGVFVAIVLRLCWPLRFVRPRPAGHVPQRVWQRPVRPPPNRRRISLCVIRV